MDFKADFFHTAYTQSIYHWMMNGLKVALKRRSLGCCSENWIWASNVHLQPRRATIFWAAEKEAGQGMQFCPSTLLLWHPIFSAASSSRLLSTAKTRTWWKFAGKTVGELDYPSCIKRLRETGSALRRKDFGGTLLCLFNIYRRLIRKIKRDFLIKACINRTECRDFKLEEDRFRWHTRKQFF